MSTRGALTALRNPDPAASTEPDFRPRSAPPLALAGRMLLALVFLAGAAFNALVTLRNLESLRGFADLAMLDVLRQLILEWVLPYATPFVFLLIAFEATVAVLLLARGAAVRLALLAVLAFCVVLIPILREFGLATLPCLALSLTLLRHEYPETVGAELRSRMDGRLRHGRTGFGRVDDANRR